jgi:hypothetical protein
MIKDSEGRKFQGVILNFKIQGRSRNGNNWYN